jgi:hypothetical protein
MLTGSNAARKWFSDFRKPNDIDFLGDPVRLRTKVYYIEDRPGYKWLLDNFDIATPSVLYTIKVAHSMWDIHWDKTIHDIRFFQRKGVELDYDLYRRLYADNEKIHGKKPAMLNKSNEAFFTDAVKRKYVHDDLHKAVAFYERPLYERCKLDINKAAISRELFFQLSYDDQLRMALEEIYATALERLVIPLRKHPIIAAKLAIKMLVTSMTKGWFPLYIVTHIDKIYECLNRDYVVKFNIALEKGLINDI